MASTRGYQTLGMRAPARMTGGGAVRPGNTPTVRPSPTPSARGRMVRPAGGRGRRG